MKIFLILILLTSFPISANFLWCESDQDNWKEVIYIADDFKEKSGAAGTRTRGTICQKGMWFSNESINSAIDGKYNQYNPSIDTWVKAAKKRKYLYCSSASKEPTYYGWFQYTTENWRSISRKSLEYYSKSGSTERTLNCSISSEDEVKFKWKELEKMQLKTNKKIKNQIESNNVI